MSRSREWQFNSCSIDKHAGSTKRSWVEDLMFMMRQVIHVVLRSEHSIRKG